MDRGMVTEPTLNTSTAKRRRRRSSIIPEIMYGEPSGSGPLRIGAHFVSKGPQHEMMSWDQVRQIVASGDLDDLVRHPACHDEYMEWAKNIRAKYGGLEKYVAKERVRWSEDFYTLAKDGSEDARYFDEAMLLEDAPVRVILNDWPYGIPSTCKHYVVWCKYPIIHPGLFQTPDTPFPPGLLRETAYKGVITDGTRGVTGNDDHVLTIGDRTQNIFQEIDLSSCNEQDIDAIVKGVSPVKNYNKALSLAYASHKWAGRFAQKFIEVFWNPDQYETAWFCNPPHLRTVPGLSHFQYVKIVENIVYTYKTIYSVIVRPKLNP